MNKRDKKLVDLFYCHRLSDFQITSSTSCYLNIDLYEY